MPAGNREGITLCELGSNRLSLLPYHIVAGQVVLCLKLRLNLSQPASVMLVQRTNCLDKMLKLRGLKGHR